MDEFADVLLVFQNFIYCAVRYWATMVSTNAVRVQFVNNPTCRNTGSKALKGAADQRRDLRIELNFLADDLITDRHVSAGKISFQAGFAQAALDFFRQIAGIEFRHRFED